MKPSPKHNQTNIKGLEAELFEINQFDRETCVAHWHKLHKVPPPSHLSLQFMRKALLFEAQKRTYGGLSRPVQSALKRALKANSNGLKHTAKIGPSLKNGAHLIREWNGKTYKVEVKENAFQMNGRDYSSLSAIAKHITGAHWSEPRFFGIRGAV